MKIKFLFHTENYGTITNDNPFIRKDDMTDEEFGGCVVEFEKTPMIQDYNNAANKIWCTQLQWDYPNTKVKSVSTELFD